MNFLYVVNQERSMETVVTEIDADLLSCLSSNPLKRKNT
jgi:hypothetical protein